MSEFFLGEIRMFAGNFAPVNWAFCDGGLLPITGNESLYVLLGTTYGGDGLTNFALPNLCGRMPVHMGQGPNNVMRDIGAVGGVEEVTLTVAQIPPHSHPATCAGGANTGNSAVPAGNVWAAQSSTDLYSDQQPDVQMNLNAIAPAGGGLPHNNMMPFLTINFIIAVAGIDPPPPSEPAAV